MATREVFISELQSSADGKKLLHFASDVNLSILMEDNGNQLVARFGGPNELTTIRRGQETKPIGTGSDLQSALSELFNQVRSAPLIRSWATEKHSVSYIGRCRSDGHFTTKPV